MSAVRYRPKRRLRSEIFPLVVILAFPVALFLAFPSGVVDFEPKVVERDGSPYFAIVRLDAKREAKLLVAARSAWQSDSASRRGDRANLLDIGGDVNVRRSSGLRPAVRECAMPAAEYFDNHIPSGLAAEAPARLADEKPVAPRPAFSRSDLLKLN